MNSTKILGLLAIATVLLGAGPTTSPERTAAPPPPPKPATPPGEVLFSDDFSSGLDRWRADRPGVWTVRRGLLRADLPDERQERSFLYTGSSAWANYALDVDVCAMRGADKGLAVRVIEGETGIGVDLRGPGYQDVLLHRREWPMGKARVLNGNGQWHHLRIEARGQRYRVWVNGSVVLDKEDSRKARDSGGIALAAYTGGVGECTVYYDNVVVTALGTGAGAGAAAGAGAP